MRLLLVNYEFPPVGGGASNATWHIGRELVRDGHQVCVLTSSFRDRRGMREEDGLRVHRVSSWRQAPDRSNTWEMGGFMLSALFAACRIARSEGIQGCIAFFTIPSGPIGLLLNKRLGIPFIVSLRGGDVPGHVPELVPVHRMLSPLRRAVLKHAAAIIANSPELAGLAARADPFPVRVVPNGVDADFYYPDEARWAGSVPFRILFVGRFRREKNLRITLDTVKDLSGNTARPIRLDIVGDGPLREEWQQYAHDLGVSEHLCWHGWLDKEQLRSLYQSAHCFVNPSLYEGMPNTVLEAMACGLPVVVSDIGGHRDLVVHGQTGFLFRLSCPADFFDALRKLAESLSMARALGSAGRARVLSEFSWRQVARSYAEIFHLVNAEAAGNAV